VDAYVQAAAAAFDIADRDRVPLWSERLRLGQADVRRLAAADCPHDTMPIGLPPETAPISRPPRAGRGRLEDIAQDVALGRTDPVERVQKALQAISTHQDLNAMRHVDADGALAQARALRERARRGERLGRMAGVVVAVKDCFMVAGLPSTSGTKAWPAQVPTRSTPCIERLQQEDAIVVGMTTMHELAFGGTTDNPHFGRVKHPADPRRLAGGSSGGSAVAVACDMADVAIGTDTAGSVRMPSALCGISGFKPSYGIVPTSGMLPLAWSLDHVGSMGTAVSDHALLTEVMAGLAQGSLRCEAPAVVRATAPGNYFQDLLDPEVRELYLAALLRLQEAGVQIVQEDVAGLELAPSLQLFTVSAEAAQIHADRALQNPEGIGDEVRVRLESGQFLRAVDYIKAQRMRSVLQESLAAPLRRGSHVLITPAVITLAPFPGTTIDVAGTSLPIHPALTRCTLPFNLTGMPAIAIPCGRTRAGLPVAIQLAAARGDDARLLAIAERVEEILGR
jgi:Asp-tRNA(Asn)/Glu-tRNA(Gln) amidotransferase A subunit family amidase